MLDKARAFWQASQAAQLAGLKEFLRIPSISSIPAHRQDVARAANFIADQLRDMNFTDVAVVPGKEGEHPLVVGQWLGAPGKPTILLYAHYDVQPVDPLTNWTTPPFEPTERDGKLWARGAVDDKGQLWILLKALEGFMRTEGKLPVNIKVLFEGEEEFTGAHIERFVHEKPEYLNGVTSAIVLDSGMYAPGTPTICTGLRGIITTEVTVRGAERDLHSGEYGGSAPNPIQALSEIIAGLKTPTGRVRIPGFYKQVKKPSATELASWAKLPFSEADFRAHLGVTGLIGDKRYSVLHRHWALPTLEINGIGGGFAGEGFKTVIPSVANAKISMRLVPDMDPTITAELFKAYVAKLSPSHVTTEVRVISASRAMLVNTQDKAISNAAAAFKQVFGADTAYTREGGSIPIAGAFQSVLGVPVLITGFSLPDCNMHAPNENLDLGNFYKGIEAVGTYLALMGA
jgi:acetylornithine deacetylase/succinyl-diaminopimelate desuccinylase-like protein